MVTTFQPSPLGELVLVYRRRLGYSQPALGRMVGIAGNTITRLETGRIQDLKFRTVQELVRVLRIPVGELYALHEEVVDV